MASKVMSQLPSFKLPLRPSSAHLSAPQCSIRPISPVPTNFSCSLCSLSAVRCCLCTSARVYLCEKCIPMHTEKPGSHRLAGVSLPSTVSPSTLQHYLERQESVEKCASLLDDLVARIAAEKTVALDHCQQVYDKKCREMLEAHMRLREDLARYYNKAAMELNAIKSNLQKEFDPHSSLPKETIRFLEVGLHLSKKTEIIDKSWFGSIRIELEPSLIPQDLHFLEYIEMLDDECVCSECEEVMVQVLQDLAWRCECGFGGNSKDYCRRCRAHKAPNSSDTHPPTTFRAKSLDFEIPQEPPNTSLPLSDENNAWKCSNCGCFGNSKFNNRCVVCEIVKGDQETLWMCFWCGRRNYQALATCDDCHKSKLWAEYLRDKGVEVADDQMKWKCGHCRNFNPMDRNNCGRCGVKNQSIAKGRIGKGKK